VQKVPTFYAIVDKDTFDVRNLTQIPKMIIACCVLHNICILQNDVMDINLDDIEQDDEESHLENNDTERVILGNEKRTRICNNL
jgi:hypothetical protein